MIWNERGGTGARTVLLVHGLGATGAVWNGVRRCIEQRLQAQWIVVDLSGHGGSEWRSTYSVGEMAAELAPVVNGSPEVLIAGHSLGAYVGLALASNWFGVRVNGVLGIGPKISWPEADLQGAREFAARPVKTYTSEAEATARYRRVSGISEQIAPGAEVLARGTVRTDQGYRLAQDPKTFLAAGAPFATLVSSATCPVLLARGETDSMVSHDELQTHCPAALSMPGVGHNAHIERPEDIVDLIARL